MPAPTRAEPSFLRHFDDLPELHSPVSGRGWLFSNQLSRDSQRFYFLFNAQYFLLFHSEYFEGILHGGLLVNDQNQFVSQAPTLNRRKATRNITKVHA